MATLQNFKKRLETIEESFEEEWKAKQLQLVKLKQIAAYGIDGCETASARCNRRSRPIFPAIVVL